MAQNNLTNLRDYLMKLAKRDTWTDGENFNPYDQSGANSDDCYYAGERDGQTNLARDLLGEYFNEIYN